MIADNVFLAFILPVEFLSGAIRNFYCTKGKIYVMIS